MVDGRVYIHTIAANTETGFVLSFWQAWPEFLLIEFLGLGVGYLSSNNILTICCCSISSLSSQEKKKLFDQFFQPGKVQSLWFEP